jgi:hypothetical protein
MNYGIEAFYLQALKKHWVLWLRTYDDNWSRWDWLPIGYCSRKGMDRTTAASHLLLEYWKFTREPRGGGYVDRPFDWINQEGLLSVADVRAIARELNQKSEATPAYAGTAKRPEPAKVPVSEHGASPERV